MGKRKYDLGALVWEEYRRQRIEPKRHHGEPESQSALAARLGVPVRTVQRAWAVFIDIEAKAASPVRFTPNKRDVEIISKVLDNLRDLRGEEAQAVKVNERLQEALRLGKQVK